MGIQELLDITIGKLKGAELVKRRLEKMNKTDTIEYDEANYDIKYYTEIKKRLKGEHLL